MTRILGRAEKVALPEFNLSGLPAKVDTGAYDASIDCESVKVVERDDQQVLEFVLLRPGRDGYTGEKLTSTHFKTKEFKNANGVQERYVLFTDMLVKDMRVHGRVSLADRSKLRYPVLLGRWFIREADCLVDVTKGEVLPGDEDKNR